MTQNTPEGNEERKSSRSLMYEMSEQMGTLM